MTCRECGGIGRVYCAAACDGSEDCQCCDGRGDIRCDHCDGSGVIAAPTAPVAQSSGESLPKGKP